MEQIRARSQALLRRFVDGVKEVEGVTLYGNPDLDRRTGIQSLNIRVTILHGWRTGSMRITGSPSGEEPTARRSCMRRWEPGSRGRSVSAFLISIRRQRQTRRRQPSGSWRRSKAMRKKTEALVISFGTTTEAMKMERHCEKEGLPGRLIPIPREITAGCGMAWKAEAHRKGAAAAGDAWGSYPGGRVCIPWNYEKYVRIYLSQMRRNMYE